jgi:hypothetical protein
MSQLAGAIGKLTASLTKSGREGLRGMGLESRYGGLSSRAREELPLRLRSGLARAEGREGDLFKQTLGGITNRVAAIPNQSAMGAIGSVAGIGAAMGIPGAGIAAGLVEATNKLREWTNSLHNSNMQFAEFSSSMAQVQAQHEVRAIQLSQQTGEARAGSAKSLSEEIDKLNQNLAPMENAWANFKNEFGTVCLKTLNKIVEGIAGGGVVGFDSALDKLLKGHPLRPDDIIEKLTEKELEVRGAGHRRKRDPLTGMPIDF